MRKKRKNWLIDYQISGQEYTLTAFPSIQGALFKGMGAMLQSLEGQIALDIMFEGVKAGIPVLPVHDSFITTSNHEDWLREQMYVQWMKHVKEGVKTRIDKKEMTNKVGR